MKVFIEAVGDAGDLSALEREWEILDKEVEPRTPFTSPLWNRLWWKYFCRKHFLAKDHFFVHVVRDDEGQLRAVVPLILACHPAFGPSKLRILRFFGADTSLTEVRGVICRRKDERVVFEALRDFLSDDKPLWDLIEWTGVQSGGAGRTVLAASAGDISPPVLTPMYVMYLPTTWKELIASVSANMRKNVRKAYEALQSTGHDYEFRVIKQLEDVGAALDCFFRLHSLRAQAPNMVTHPDKFSAPKNRAFITDYCTQIAKRDGLRIFQLCIEGNVVASRLAFNIDGILYFYYAGYDPAWRAESIMTVLMADALKWAIEREVKIVNLSTGKDLSKLRWRPKEVAVFESFTQTSTFARRRVFRRGYVASYVFMQNIYNRLQLSRRRRSPSPLVEKPTSDLDSIPNS